MPNKYPDFPFLEEMAEMCLTKPLIILLAMAVLAPWARGLNPPSKGPKYHGGALLNGNDSINAYIIWYGAFSDKEKAPITDFFASFAADEGSVNSDSVAKWWKITNSYRDQTKNPVSSLVKLVKQVDDTSHSLGKADIKRVQIADYVKSKIDTGALPYDLNGVYLVLTAKDVTVEKFCIGSCGYHDSVKVTEGKRRLVYAHVGDPSAQCPSLCAWPYAVPAYGPPGKALVAPNGVGPDGMVMNIATILAGAATNPFQNGYFQGDVSAPLEAVTACPGVFGAGAHPGFPGKLMVDLKTEASYNTYGVNDKKFLLPAIWDPVRATCMVEADTLVLHA